MSCQQTEVYRAEERALRRLAEGPAARQLSLREAQDMVNGWRDLPWWQDRFSTVRYVDVRSHPLWQGSVGTYVESERAGVVEMDERHMTPLIVCHEVSHVLSEARWGSRAHDPWFCRTYLQLVSLALGSEAYLALYEEFEATKIDHDTKE